MSKSHYSILIFLLVQINAYSQFGSLDQIERDSLRGLSKSDHSISERITAYHELSTDLMFTDSIQAFQLLDTAMILSKEFKYIRGIISTKMSKASILMEYSAYEEAKVLYEEVIELIDKNELLDLKVEAILGLGIVAEDLGDFDHAIFQYEKSVGLARTIGDSAGIADALHYAALLHQELGNTKASILALKESSAISKALKDQEGIASSVLSIGMYYHDLEEYGKAIEYYNEALKSAQIIHQPYIEAAAINNLGSAYYSLNQYEKALTYFEVLLDLDRQAKHKSGIGISLINMGRAQYHMKKYEKAAKSFEEAYQIGHEIDDVLTIADGALGLGETFLVLGNSKAIEYLKESYTTANEIGYLKLVKNSAKATSEYYERVNNYKNALDYFKIYHEALDSLSNKEKTKAISRMNAEFEFQVERDSLKLVQEKQRITYEANLSRRKEIQFITIVVLVIVIILLMVIFIVNRGKQKAIVNLSIAKDQLNKQLAQLKSTQTQLIHSEKMASLGELTAGIAHEIQNPLNFVNNFSDLNQELVGEQIEELSKGDIEEAKLIAADIKENESKINHHGKRAAEIVKSMLQHSRGGDGEKVPTDINALSDEYLRLSYHGLRAKDKSFNAEFKTALDPDLPKVNVVPQDIGRVLLNLINNAFQAVKEVKQPEVIVSTRLKDNQVEILVKDNGPGIPDEIKDKIFQPFFTTKATGEGTGLGLSMSYDIVTKGHEGTIKVQSNGNGTVFIVSLKPEQ